MISKRERAEFWPDEYDLYIAQRAQARGILRLLREDEWKEPSTDKVRIMGNYMLLSSFITPEYMDRQPKTDRIEREKLSFINGLLVAGCRIPAAVRNADTIYGTNLRKMIYPLLHIPDGSPELIETRRNGRIVGRSLDIEVLCEQAHALASPEADV